MRPRVRLLAALLALLALSLSFGEQAWASLCMPAGADSAAAMHAGHGAPAPEHPEQPSPSPGDGCPLLAAAACAVVSLPASAASIETPEPLPGAAVPTYADQTHRLLLSTQLFRPPRA